MTLDRLYRFVQFEFAWPLGPADGRYLLRDHAGEEAHHVLVVATLATAVARRGRLLGRDLQPRPVPAETGLGRATLVDTAPVGDEAARRWLDAAAGERRDDTVQEALHWLNWTLRAHRAATADAGVQDATEQRALVIRAGYGAGFEVADGAWTAARELPPGTGARATRRARRQAALQPQERLAALLSGRDAVLASEELALRARADLAAGRAREAALQAHIAVEAAVAELQAFSAGTEVARWLPRLEGHRQPLAAAANEVLGGGPSDATLAAVEDGLQAIEAALRARATTVTY